MPYDLILKNIAKHITLDEEETAYFITLLKPRQLLKKEVILGEGQICRNINFVSAGTLRAFHTSNAGKESTVMFAVADWWVTDMYSFIQQKPAMLSIDAIASTAILQLQNNDLEKLYIQIPKFEKFFRVLMQNAYIREQLRNIENLSQSAEVRYDNFVAKYPQVIKQVTQKQIASYLGITPEFLSVLRKNKTKKPVS